MKIEMRFPDYISKELLSSKKVRGSVLRALQLLGKEVKDKADSTMEGWDNNDEKFTVSVRYAGGDVNVSITTNNALWQILNEGTALRWSVMRDPFSPRTTPGTLAVGPGGRTYAGGQYTAIRGQQAMMEHNISPRPGIEPRAWDLLIAAQYEAKLGQVVRDAVMAALLKRSARR